MKIALIHNPNAFRGEADVNEVRQVFERAGHDVVYVSTQAANWQQVISPEITRAIIVGGDGTVEQVAPLLGGMPFSILPSGTANNIGRCLHQTSNPELLASQLNNAEIRHLDLGKVTHGSESKSFLECSGLGVFAELILAMQDCLKKEEMERAESREEKFAQALEQLQVISRAQEAMALELKADDAVISDRFIMIAVMNMELIGPRLNLAPGADPGDGHLDLVLVREGQRENLCRWLDGESPGQKNAAHFEIRRCHRIEVNSRSIVPVHVDSLLIQRPNFPLVVEVEPGALNYTLLKA